MNIIIVNLQMRVKIGDYYVNIGKNAHDNWNILDNSEAFDIWFHVDNSSSPYVILEVKDNNTIPDQIIDECAKLCKNNSKSKTSKNVPIIYCEVSNLAKGSKLGSVVLKNTPKKVII
jgi:predicted ribosome quality control (RQC) complex YloA/Tae2 family protein